MSPEDLEQALKRLRNTMVADAKSSQKGIGSRSSFIRGYIRSLTELIKRSEANMLLYPDMLRDQHDAGEFCFAAPCSITEWVTMRNKSQMSHCKDSDYLPFAYYDDEGEQICIIPRESHESDDQCVITAAFIRMTEDFTGMIYAVPKTSNHALEGSTFASIISRTAGVPPSQVRNIEVNTK